VEASPSPPLREGSEKGEKEFNGAKAERRQGGKPGKKPHRTSKSRESTDTALNSTNYLSHGRIPNSSLQKEKQKNCSDTVLQCNAELEFNRH
jgi:hypothetical protein